jgi:hypothetical protein
MELTQVKKQGTAHCCGVFGLLVEFDAGGTKYVEERARLVTIITLLYLLRIYTK